MFDGMWHRYASALVARSSEYTAAAAATTKKKTEASASRTRSWVATMLRLFYACVPGTEQRLAVFVAGILLRTAVHGVC